MNWIAAPTEDGMWIVAKFDGNSWCYDVAIVTAGKTFASFTPDRYSKLIQPTMETLD